MKGTLHEDRFTFFIIQYSFLLGIRNVTENVIEKIKTHFVYIFFFKENRAVYEKMLNILQGEAGHR